MSKVGCPVTDFSCPYCDANGQCELETRADDCDDFMAVMADLSGLVRW